MTKRAVTRSIRLLLERDLLRDRAWSVAELAEHFGVSERTISYDLMVLQSEPLYVPLIREAPRYRIQRVGEE